MFSRAAAGAAEQQLAGEVFSNMCYRRKPVVSYITEPKAWNEGRRDILDWGCGGGALSMALAERGAGRVVADDLNKAVAAANQRLRFFRMPLPGERSSDGKLLASRRPLDRLPIATSLISSFLTWAP